MALGHGHRCLGCPHVRGGVVGLDHIQVPTAVDFTGAPDGIERPVHDPPAQGVPTGGHRGLGHPGIADGVKSLHRADVHTLVVYPSHGINDAVYDSRAEPVVI